MLWPAVKVNPVVAILYLHLSYRVPENLPYLVFCVGVTTFYQVDTWRDDNYLSSDDDLTPMLAADICVFAAVNCSLRAAFWYASSLPGDDVIITLNAGGNLSLTQGDYIPITGYEHHA